jgi:hypothetical protein
MQSSGELVYWPIYAKTDAPERLLPNWTLPDHFPQLNFIVGDLPSSAREDSERRGHVLVFPVIGGLLVQFGGSASITGLWEYSNEGAEGVGWPESRWPRWG